MNENESIFDEFEDDFMGTELTSRMTEEELDLGAEQDWSTSGLFDANYEKELGSSNKIFTTQDIIDHEFEDIAKLNIVQVGGDDKFGKKVIIIYACRIPPTQEINLERFWAYTVKTLKQFVSNDYSLIYFHYGLTSKNNPGIKFMINAYKQIDRDFKKNLKNMYIVHPTNLLKIIISTLLPLFSNKVRNKIVKIRKLNELESQFYLDQMVIPEIIKTHDDKLDSPHSDAIFYDNGSHASSNNNFYQASPESQFGVTLQHIKQYYSKSPVPPVMEQCIMYLRNECLDCEGIFRRSASKILLVETQKKYDLNEFVDLSEHGDPHLAACLLKTFLRSLKEPLMTFELYDEIIKIHNCKTEEAVENICQIVCEMLPDYNYCVLKYLIDFLIEVADHSETNKMTFQNLANVFAPNLIWSRHETSITIIHLFIQFTFLLLTNYSDIFLKESMNSL